MQPETQSPLPALNLTPAQEQVIMAHAIDAGTQIMNLRFTDKEKFDQMLFSAFQQGRRESFLALLNYDQEMLKQIQETANSETQPNMVQ